MTINKDSGVPIYYQLADSLRNRITGGEFLPGELLPSENVLSDTYGISRGTVRKALQLLSNEGVMETWPGKGSVVAHTKFEYDVGNVPGFFSHIVKAAGKTPSARILEMSDLDPVPDYVRKLFKTDADDSVFHLRRVRYVGDEAWAIEDSCFSGRVGELLKSEDLSKASIYETLQEKHGLRFGRSENSITAVLLDSENAELLNIGSETPVLRLSRHVSFDDGTLFEYSEDFFRCDRIKLKLAVDYQRQGAHFELAQQDR